MRRWLFLFVLFAPLTCSSTGSQAQGDTLERSSINLSIPKGYCAIDPSNPADALILKFLQQKVPAGAQVAAPAAECAHLEAWRKPPVQPVDSFTVYYVVAAPGANESATHEVRVGLPAWVCKITRQETGQATNEPASSLESRLEAVLRTLRTGETKKVGVIHEEPGACYAVVVERVQIGAGEPASGLIVGAVATIKGQVLRFEHWALTSSGKEVAALRRSADLLKETVRANFAANR